MPYLQSKEIIQYRKYLYPWCTNLCFVIVKVVKKLKVNRFNRKFSDKNISGSQLTQEIFRTQQQIFRFKVLGSESVTILVTSFNNFS